MIEFNLSVPKVDKNIIISIAGNKFSIISKSPMGGDRYWFLIEADIEDMLMFTLKYGQENVWKRHPTNYSAP